jgi:hypothetical protein
MNSEKPKMPNVNGPGSATKSPYVKPAFRHEKVFETMALACGKINNTQLSCKSNKKNS